MRVRATLAAESLTNRQGYIPTGKTGNLAAIQSLQFHKKRCPVASRKPPEGPWWESNKSERLLAQRRHCRMIGSLAWRLRKSGDNVGSGADGIVLQGALRETVSPPESHRPFGWQGNSSWTLYLASGTDVANTPPPLVRQSFPLPTMLNRNSRSRPGRFGSAAAQL